MTLVADLDDDPLNVTEQTQLLHCANDTECHTHFEDSVTRTYRSYHPAIGRVLRARRRCGTRRPP